MLHYRMQRYGPIMVAAAAVFMLSLLGGCEVTRPTSVADAYPTGGDNVSRMIVLEQERMVILRVPSGAVPLGPSPDARIPADLEVLRRAHDPLWAR